MDKSFGKQVFLALMAILGWFALIGQLYLIIKNSETSLAETLVRYFCFFTILTNTIVAYCCTVLLLKPTSIAGNFFSKQTNITATTLYILVVGLIYNIVLRILWKPEGLQLIVNEILHTVIPIFFVFYWFIYAAKSELQWKNLWAWMIYPLVYTIVILLRGASTGEYPYPFIDVTELGYPKTFINCGFITIVFFLFAFLLIGISKWKNRKTAEII